MDGASITLPGFGETVIVIVCGPGVWPAAARKRTSLAEARAFVPGLAAAVVTVSDTFVERTLEPVLACSLPE